MKSVIILCSIMMCVNYMASCDKGSRERSGVPDFNDLTHRRMVYIHSACYQYSVGMDNKDPSLYMKDQEFIELIDAGLGITVGKPEDIVDAWGNQLMLAYEKIGSGDDGQYAIVIRSAGKNGIFGDADDLEYPRFDEG